MKPSGRGRGRGKKKGEASPPVIGAQVKPPSKGRGRGGRGRANSPPPQETSNHVVARYDNNGRVINPNRRQNQLQLLHRKDYGTVGKPIRLYTNFYEIKTNSKAIIYHYDFHIKVSEKLLKQDRMFAMRIFLKWKEDNEVLFSAVDAVPVFDGGRSMYTNKPVLDKGKMFTILFPVSSNRTDAIEVMITPTSQRIELNDIEKIYNKESTEMPFNILSFADILLGYLPKLSYTSFNRSYFPPQSNAQNLGSGIELWSGSTMSVKPGQWKLLVNIDERHTAFYKKQNLRDFIAELFPHLGCRPLKPDESRRLREHVRGLRVDTHHLSYRRPYRVAGVCDMPATQQHITDNRDQRQKSVAQYFQDQYNITLKHGYLPCIHMEPKAKNVFIPAELIEIQEGQRCVRSLTDDQIAKIIRSSAIKPDLKKSRIESFATDLLGRSREIASKFGMELVGRPVQVKGRILPAPSIKYNDTVEVRTNGGQWNGRRLRRAANLDNWGIVCMAPQSRDLKIQDFEREIRREGQKMGIGVTQPRLLQYVREHDFITVMTKVICENNHRLDYLFVILPPRSSSRDYSMVKELEIKFGITTQCIRYDTLQKKFRSKTVGNVLLKTNAKLGGVNWEVAHINSIKDHYGKYVFQEPVMIIGADVTHWTRNEGNKPSIAGVVASLDRQCSVYASKISLQPYRPNRASTEIIQNFKSIVKYLLTEFHKRNKGIKPAKILYYRDGVSQGQFIQTLTEEIAGIQAACKELEDGYQPCITYINAQKRHHTRIFTVDRADADRSGNVPPGTVIDTEITNPILFDFYLSSHAGIQGTNRPCHYSVLWDDSNFTPDFIQLLTYYLCHTYARCTRSVSYPAPTYYAHLLCARARTMLGCMNLNWYGKEKPSLERLERQLTQNKKLENSVYFI